MIYYIFGDESRQIRERYMVLGGIILESSDLQNAQNTIEHFREEERMTAELKWTKVSRTKLPQYKSFVDYFFALNNTSKIHFHSLIVDSHLVDHRQYSEGDAELSFNKFYYQLLLNGFGRRYAAKDPDAKFLVRLDERSSPYSLNELKRILNLGMKKNFKNYSDPFKTIEPRDSKLVDLLQMTDVILGAIGWQKNGFDLIADSSPAKRELAQYIAEKAGLRDLGNTTALSRNAFTVWNIKLD